MGADLAALALTAGYCFAGMGVLAALRAVSATVGGVLAALGLAFMVGVALVMLVGIELLSVGGPIGLGTLGATALVIGVGGFAVAWRGAGPGKPSLRGEGSLAAAIRTRISVLSMRRARRWVRTAGVDQWTAAAVLLALAVFAVVTFRWARVQPLQVWDSWSIWARKGTLLFDYGHLPTAFFTSPVYSFMHQDYPLLLPLYESTWFHAVGSADTQSLHVWFWVLFVAALWASGYVASRIARPAVWAPLVGLIAVTPAIWNQLMTMYADVPMGLFLMLGVLCLGLWISGRKRRDLALAAILLAAAASTKNEGLTGAVSVLAVAAIVTAVAGAPGLSRRKALAPLGVAIAAFVAAIAPWRLWVASHRITTEISASHGLRPSYVMARTGRVGPALNALIAEVGNQGNWCYLLPIGMALLVAGIVSRRLRTVAAFYGLAAFGAFVLILWAYVISPAELSWLISTSASRTVVGPMMIVVAGTFHLAGELTRQLQRVPARARSAAGAAPVRRSPRQKPQARSKRAGAASGR
jgi:hypothetical protein